jgi:hypothetical protein
MSFLFKTGLVNVSSVDSVFDYSGFIPRYFDVVIEGGGPNAIYILGLYDMLKKLEKTGDITISRYVGSDVSAIMSVLLCSNVEKETMIDFCKMMFEDITNNRWKRKLLSILPKDAYSTCNNRVYIYTSVSSCGLYSLLYHPIVFSRFCSNRDLVEACVISFQKPKKTNFYNGKQTQLRINLNKLNEIVDNLVFSHKRIFQFYRITRMTEFILKGEQDADDFFSQNPRISKNLLEWVHPSPVRKYKFFYFFVPSVFLLFFLLRKKKN